MAIPTARTKIEILKLSGVAAAVMAGSNTRYARASIKIGAGPTVMTGRSRPIPDAGGVFDLIPEAWVFEANSLNPSDSISITVNILKDLGDSAPPAATAVTASIPDPWKSGVATFGAVPSLEIRVTTTYVNPTDAAFVARASAASGVSATLTAPQGFVVQFVDILGLYKPSPPAPPPALGSVHVAGYISEDNLGRVYTNRLPNGTWKRDTQFIEVQAKVTAFGGPTIPAGAKIQWTISDPDDPTNDSSSFHRDWGPYVDPNDYGPAPAFAPLGAHAGDNVAAFSPGNASESKLFGSGVSGSARWHAVTGGPAPSPASSSKAKSPLVPVDPKTAKTSVRIHCPNVLGTNMVIKAELIGTPAGIPVHNASTGIITMWSRLDVEVKRMSSGFSLSKALPKIPPFFLTACVQLDFQAEAPVPAALNQEPMAPSDDLEETKTAAWVNHAFTNKARGGWFFLGAAGHASPVPPATSSSLLFDGTAYLLDTLDIGTSPHHDVEPIVMVTGAFADPKYVEFSWMVAGKRQIAGFGVALSVISGTQTLMVLQGNDLTPLFTGHDADGSIKHAYLSQRYYFPRHEKHHESAPLVAGSGGFAVPSAGAHVQVFGLGAVATSGMSPELSTGGLPYFGGRTVIYTRFYQQELLSEPSKPTVLQNPMIGTFASGRDVFIGITLVNAHGETPMSEPFSFSGTTGSDGFVVSPPVLTAWHAGLGAGNVPTGYNVYEADVPTGSAAPHPSAFKKAASVAGGWGAAIVDKTATGPAPPASNTAAITPPVPRNDFDDDVVQTVVHEFTHAFGMPHKCGYWDWRTPRNHSCCMNYFDSWLVGPPPAFKLLLNTGGNESNDMCGRHLMEVRRVHLERNKALKALGW